MRRLKEIPSFMVLASAFSLVATPCAGQADVSPPDVSKAVVVVVASAKVRGVEVVARATGFFINKQGLLLTSDHLRTSLGPVDPGTVTYGIYSDEVSSTAFPASVVLFSEVNDYLILKSVVGAYAYNPIPRGDPHDVQVQRTRLFTRGYPAGLSAVTVRGSLLSLDGTVTNPSFTWTTDFRFKAGQSGSPIYDDHGRVLAIARGSDHDADQYGFVVPIMAVGPEWWPSGNAGGSLAPAQSTAPQLIASTTVTASGRRDRTKSLSFRHKPCGPNTRYTSLLQATPGWEIDLDTVSVVPLRSVGADVAMLPTASTSKRIAVSATLTNPTTCPVGSVADPAQPVAEADVEVDYVEHPLPGTTEEQILASTPLVAGRNVRISGAPVGDLRLTVERNDGTRTEVVATRDNLIQRKGAIAVDAAALISQAASQSR